MKISQNSMIKKLLNPQSPLNKLVTFFSCYLNLKIIEKKNKKSMLTLKKQFIFAPAYGLKSL